jgi:hypothetical protein
MSRAVTGPIKSAIQAASLAKQPLFSPNTAATLNEIDALVSETALVQRDERAGSCVGRAFALAAGMQRLRELLSEDLMNAFIMPLMNTRIGFRTDRDPNRLVRDRNGKTVNLRPYPLGVVRECLIEALLRGAYPINNEFNIIAGGAYLTREFFERALGELPGIAKVVASPGVPRFDGNGAAMVRFGLSWQRDGQDECLLDGEGKPGRVFAIKADAYSSCDQIIGKATRKAYAAAYQQITGSKAGLPEGDAGEVAAAAAAERERMEVTPVEVPPTRRPVSENQTFIPEGLPLDLDGAFQDPYIADQVEDLAGVGAFA